MLLDRNHWLFFFGILIYSYTNISYAAPASIGTCPTVGCAFTVTYTPEGSTTSTVSGTGFFDVNTQNGDVTLRTAGEIGNGMVNPNGGLMWNASDGSRIMVNNLAGNSDPILLFGVGAVTGASGGTFAYSFDLPIAIGGLIDANSTISYSLTASGAPGAGIAGLGGNNIMRAFEVDTDFIPGVQGLPSLNKGVDAGDDFGFAATGLTTMNSPVYAASNQFTGSTEYDLMSVIIEFQLTKNSSVGISGGVEQLPVPVPAAVWLMGSALIGLVGIRRKA